MVAAMAGETNVAHASATALVILLRVNLTCPSFAMHAYLATVLDVFDDLSVCPRELHC